MAEAQLQCQGNFVTLFSTNFPHIFENIFFSLDYDSYKNCMKVNSEWADVLTSERYKTKAKVVFREEIFLEEETRKLLNAARTNDTDEAERILANGLIDVDCTNNEHRRFTPLVEAVIKGHKEMARFLVSQGADSRRLEEESGIGQVWLQFVVFEGRTPPEVLRPRRTTTTG